IHSTFHRMNAFLRHPNIPEFLLLVSTTILFLAKNPLALLSGSMALGLMQPVSIAPDRTWLQKNIPSLAKYKFVETTMEMSLPKVAFDELHKKKISNEQIAAIAMSNSAGGIGPL